MYNHILHTSVVRVLPYSTTCMYNYILCKMDNNNARKRKVHELFFISITINLYLFIINISNAESTNQYCLPENNCVF